MRPMTVREALQIVREYPLCDDGEQARRIMDALVELREANKAWLAQHWTLCGPEAERVRAAEDKLASLERGEEPQA